MPPEPDVEVDEAVPFVSGPPSIGDFLGSGRRAVVIDPELARSAPCVAFELGAADISPITPEGGERLVFVQGAVGPLDEEQQATYCETVAVRELSPELQKRLTAFRDAAEVCNAVMPVEMPEGTDALSMHLGCMAQELRERGEKL